MLVDCGFTGLTKQGKGCQEPGEMIAVVDDNDELMLTNMTQVKNFFIFAGNSHSQNTIHVFRRLVSLIARMLTLRLTSLSILLVASSLSFPTTPAPLLPAINNIIFMMTRGSSLRYGLPARDGEVISLFEGKMHLCVKYF